MQILYIASVRIPNEKASGFAIMRQCEAFVCLGHTLTLLRPNRKNHLLNDPFAFYGINTKFKVHTFLSLDMVDKIGKLGFYITRLSQMVGSFLYVLKNKIKIDLVYARDPWMLILPIFFMKEKNIIWEAHQKQGGFFVKFVAKRSTRFICISSGLKEYYKEMTNRADILVEPSGVNLDQFSNLPSVESLRRQFGIPLDKKVVGYIGKYTTMGEGKGVDELIQAFALIYKNYPKMHLFIAGLEFTEIESVNILCRNNGLESDSFTLVPLEQKDFASYTHVADILIMNYPDTEHYRHFMSPTKLFAYMASNKIVIASDLPTVRAIADESMILFTSPNSVESLKKVLVKCIHENISFVFLKQNALKRVQDFTWSNRAKRILCSL